MKYNTPEVEIVKLNLDEEILGNPTDVEDMSTNIEDPGVDE